MLLLQAATPLCSMPSSPGKSKALESRQPVLCSLHLSRLSGK